MRHVKVKFLGMRKEDECVVYPYSEGQTEIMFQGDRTVGQFNIETGEGVLNCKGSNAKYGHHLSKMFGAVPFKYSPEFVKECLAAQPKPGDSVGPGVIIG